MTPPNIANMSYINGLGAIAVTDHNSSRNVAAVMNCAKELPLLVIPGIELCTVEEVHVVCLFPTLEACIEAGVAVEKLLIPIINDPEIFGHQWIMNEEEQITGNMEHLLINATTISIDQVVPFVAQYGGICYPAHVEKPSYSLLSNLGFITPEMGFSTIEVKNMDKLKQHSFGNQMLQDYKVITSSDAHYLQDISLDEQFIMVKEKSVASIIDYLKEKI